MIVETVSVEMQSQTIRVPDLSVGPSQDVQHQLSEVGTNTSQSKKNARVQVRPEVNSLGECIHVYRKISNIGAP